MNKSELRTLLRSRRAAHVRMLGEAGDLDLARHHIAGRIMARLDGATILSAYLSDGAEVDALPTLEAAAAQGLETALPHVTRRTEPMRFLRWRPGDALVEGPFGLRQPRDDAPELLPDLILTPLLGFDRTLARLGQGAGFYDRAFASLPAARRIGLAWSVQEMPALPCDPWDIPLHAIVTEKEWIGQ
ncbi:5-formyltetrahydrofolate cyclo-ligase [Sphingomonas oleivorans]|uniref:5-formyltetrahydrofolate cyclo-ligase n=1 Tax=Sphingomonas oleivorans TaxID=1735121 RepID=A0A2T5FYM8_9SPHN|nr:5-formyltetrahydrofolate cyclo-ligase [Sphingomonas oleivorans]PTQ11648.1 5-formyltetrahydrofolate cyclo-ligase [Sphingomonas oleivorans]